MPESFEELTSLILQKDSKDDDYLYPKVWRGQADISWRIDSSGYRRIINEVKPHRVTDNFEKKLRFYESQLLKHATHQGYRFHNGRMLSDFELLAKLQHHGAATRLVDFTRNALVALWFVCSNLEDEMGLLIGIHTNSLGGTESSPMTETYLEVVKSIEKYNHSQVYESPSISPRIAAQHAQFLYSTVSNEPYSSLKLGDNKDYITFIAISPQLKKESLHILEMVYDYRTITLFPDLDGFGMANNFNIEPHRMSRW